MQDTFWVEESSVPLSVCKKRKRRVGKRKIEFIGWGSRPLIEFLEAIGKDTKEKHSRQEVAAFINKYIIDKSLTSAEKKKKVICDEILFALFGKKTIPRIKVYDMLDEHFAENHDDSDDELLDSSDEDYGENKSLESKKIPTGQTKKALKTPKSCFAAIIPENIKLIYLKRTVVQELLKFPESFECKLMGSFVRIKSDPNDIYQKNRFQLQKVTGLEKVSGAGDADIVIHLRLSNFFKDVPIHMLSDDNFSEEEIEDVRDRIKAGSLNKLTVNELQLKAQVLHADITKNWITKEISMLQKRAEHANEKGWQREKFDYLERRKMLQKPSEQEKLLFKLPEVIAEELEPEVTVDDASEKAEAEIGVCSPKSILRGSSDVSSTDASGSGEISTPPKVVSGDSHALKVQNGSIDGVVDVPIKDPLGDSHALKVQNGSIDGVVDVPIKDPLGDSHALKVQNGSMDGVVHVPLKDPSCDSHALKVQNGSIDGVHVPLKAAKVYKVEQGKLVPIVTFDESSREMQGAGAGKKHPQGEPEQPVYEVEQGKLIPSVTIDGSSREMQGAGAGKKHPQGEPEQPIYKMEQGKLVSSVTFDESSRKVQGAGARKKHPQGEPEQPVYKVEQGKLVPIVTIDESSREMQGVGAVKKHPQGEPEQPVYKVEQGKLVSSVTFDKSSREVQGAGAGKKHPQGEPEQPVYKLEQGKLIPSVTFAECSRDMQGAGDGKKHLQGEPEQPLLTTRVVAGPSATLGGSGIVMQQVMGSGENGPQGRAEQRPSTITVIELSDDELEGESQITVKYVDENPNEYNWYNLDLQGLDDDQKIVQYVDENPNEVKWYYVDPQGQTQGPFPLFMLKQWSDANFFGAGFTVWKSGQTYHDRVLLVDVLHQTYL